MQVPIQKLKRFNHRGTYSHNKTFGAPIAAPATLGRTAKYFKDQGISNYCTGAVGSVMGSYLFGTEMSFEYQTAKEGQVIGQPIYNGADPESRNKAYEEYGFLPDEQCPLKFVKDGWTRPADWRDAAYTNLDGQAIVNTGFAPFNVYPDYDSVKTALISGNEDNGVVALDGFWFKEWQNPREDGILPIPQTSAITRHDYIAIDFFTDSQGIERLVLQLSQGTNFGKGGLLYMDKITFNTAFKYPAYNGLGATILRKGVANPIQTQITALQRLIQLCGELLTVLRLKV